jgi:hypothetical protein
MPTPLADLLKRGLKALGSLKLTVALLAMSIFIVFAGTLAQRESGIWTVVERYFRCWVAWIHIRDISPRDWNVPASWVLLFPGGWLLGAALVVNLLVSHSMRIRLEARGPRLILGVAVALIGAALTWMVVAHAFDADTAEKKIPPFWRVTYQLLQGGGVALVLFFGAKMLFGRKAGIVLLHSGLILMMMSELITGLSAEEGMMTIAEGQSSNFCQDNRHVELAFIDTSPADHDWVVVVPEWRLKRGGTIHDSLLPCDLEVAPPGFMKNAGLRAPRPGEPNPATSGRGLTLLAQERGEEPGAAATQRVDLPALYVRLKDQKSEQTFGTYLAAVGLSLSGPPERVTLGGKTYTLSLRFKRTYKPYELRLTKFRYDRYPGTTIAKNFSSDVRLVDPERGTDREARIWMNNPLRYRGDTLYQADWDHETEAGTVLQVVSNAGWMVPYLGCMIVAVGLLGQFGLHLVGFLKRRMEEAP